MGLAGSPLAPPLGRLPIRGPANLLHRSFSKHPPTGTVEAINNFGDRIVVNKGSFIEWQVWAFGAYELDTLRLITQLVGPGDTFVDIGANVGLMTVRAARAGADVVAIEADPAIAERLRQNLKANGLTGVTVMNVGAADAMGTMTLHRADPGAANQGQASLIAHEHLRGGEVIEIPVMTLDSLELPAVKLLKVDVEGAEGSVIRGAWDTIERCRPHVLFEMELSYSDDYGFTSRFEELGYTLQTVTADRHRWTGQVRGPRLVPLTSGAEHNVLASPS